MATSIKILSSLNTLAGALAVAGGALGAHSLSKVLDAHQLDIYNKGIQYQMLHVLAGLAVIIMYQQSPHKILHNILILFLLGILCFSGSLYLLVYLLYAHMDVPTPVALITPMGGLLFISGWLTWVYYFIKQPHTIL